MRGYFTALILSLLIVCGCSPPVSAHDPGRYVTLSYKTIELFISQPEIETLMATPAAISRSGSGPDPNGMEYEELEKQLKELMEELKRLEKDVKNKFQKDMLPFIKREIERLKKGLRKLRPKKEEQEPIMTRMLRVDVVVSMQATNSEIGGETA